jgi:hypothetical protein
VDDRVEYGWSDVGWDGWEVKMMFCIRTRKTFDSHTCKCSQSQYTLEYRQTVDGDYEVTDLAVLGLALRHSVGCHLDRGLCVKRPYGGTIRSQNSCIVLVEVPGIQQ